LVTVQNTTVGLWSKTCKPHRSPIFTAISAKQPLNPRSGSTDIIDDYWNKKGGRPAPSSASKSKRKSTAGTNSKRQVSHTPSTKKRRFSESPSAAGTKEKNGAGEKMTVEDHDEQTLGDVANDHKDSMAAYKDLPSWEEHVDRISTVERSANNRLVVYLVM
jgi:hypothetical protein